MDDPFETLGIARRYDVDLRAVEKQHRELSRALHPDRFVNAPASEKKAALEKAVAANEAWRVVRDPIRRAEAILALAGVAVDEAKAPKPDAEFLMEMLELREALADAKGARDLAKVRAMGKDMEARTSGAEKALAESFARGDAATLAGLVPRVGELRFYRRVLDEVSAIEDELAA
ncbi:MAG TPA: Fe-S protein assembly co-chaperone HscB [Polyangiaceae bacterium]|jgi:molecular chaperone HscB